MFLNIHFTHTYYPLIFLLLIILILSDSNIRNINLDARNEEDMKQEATVKASPCTNESDIRSCGKIYCHNIESVLEMAGM